MWVAEFISTDLRKQSKRTGRPFENKKLFWRQYRVYPHGPMGKWHSKDHFRIPLHTVEGRCQGIWRRQVYVTLNRRSIIKEAAATVDRGDQVNLQINLKSVACPAEGVDSINRFLSCSRCQVKLAPIAGKNIVKCSKCGLAQMKNKCKQRFLASVLFKDNDLLMEVLLTVDANVFYNSKRNAVSIPRK